MPRVVGLQEFELKPGVTEAELEQAIRHFVAQPCPPGWRSALLRSNRGTNPGKYCLLFDIDSDEARQSVVTDDGITEEFKQFVANHSGWLPAWEGMFALVVQPNIWNDYWVLVE